MTVSSIKEIVSIWKLDHTKTAVSLISDSGIILLVSKQEKGAKEQKL